MESTLQGKNLLLEEQILPIKSGPLLRRKASKRKEEELIHLKVYPFTFMLFTDSIRQ